MTRHHPSRAFAAVAACGSVDVATTTPHRTGAAVAATARPATTGPTCPVRLVLPA